MDWQTLPPIERIGSVFPEPVQSTTEHHGDDFLVIEVNGEWMFRFPRRAECLAVLEIEKKFLSAFSNLSPIPVPHYEIQAPGFVGYRKINGLLLSSPRFNALAREKQRQVAGQLGAFLSTLHSFPVEHARQMGVTEGWNGFRKKALATFKSEIAPRLSQRALRNAMSCLEAVLSAAPALVVVHGDLYPREHVFLDLQQMGISGIIDFGDLTLEEPACDLKNIFSELGEEVFQMVMEQYQAPVDAGLIPRMRLLTRAEPLFDAAYDVQFGYPGRLTHHIRDIEYSFGR